MTWAEEERYSPAGSTALIQRVHDEGLIFAINDLVLHPLGLAFGVSGERDSDHHVIVAGLGLFRVDDPEGVVYENDAAVRARAVEKLRAAGHDALADKLEGGRP